MLLVVYALVESDDGVMQPAFACDTVSLNEQCAPIHRIADDRRSDVRQTLGHRQYEYAAIGGFEQAGREYGLFRANGCRKVETTQKTVLADVNRDFYER